MSEHIRTKRIAKVVTCALVGGTALFVGDQLARQGQEIDALQDYYTSQIDQYNSNFSNSAIPATPTEAPATTQAPAATQAPGTAKAAPKTKNRATTAKSYEAEFNQLASQLGGSVALSWTPKGRGGQVNSLGNWKTGPAWSTAKVPVAIAVERDTSGKPDAGTRHDLKSAITASNNDAAKALWGKLGTPEQAAAKAQKVVGDAGDTTTKIQSRKTRSEFTAFGQTNWSVGNQAKFAAALGCIPMSRGVVDLMGQVIPEQRFGIGAVGDQSARFKGGWGPDPKGNYLTRQLGTMRLKSGETIGIAIASVPTDGSFETGKANLTKIAKWAVANIQDVGKAAC